MAPERKDTERIFEEAAEWFHRRESGQFDPVAFEKWLFADLRHDDAYRSVEEADFQLKNLRLNPEMRRLENEILLEVGHRSRFQTPRLTKAVSRRLFVGAGGAGLAALGIAIWRSARPEELYKTAVGEQRTVLLSDGSKMDIDANAEVAVSISKRARDIKVISGRANFNVYKDPFRPFRVQARDKVITALGTAFSVDLTSNALSVMLTEGVISIGQTSKDGFKPKLIIPRLTGQKLVRLDTGAVSPLIKAASPASELSWMNGVINFDNETLVAAADRMNNYSGLKIQIEGKQARELQVTGQFSAGRSDAFVDAVTSYFPLAVERPDAQTIVLRHR